MIKPHELSVGNILLFDNLPSLVSAVARIPEATVMNEQARFTLRARRVHPILLTHEALLVLGFEYIGCESYVLDCYEGDRKMDLEFHHGILRIKTRYMHHDQVHEIPHIRYAHQVQNLHVALTGKEIKATKPLKLIAP